MGCHVDGDGYDRGVASTEGGEVGIGGLGLEVGELSCELEGTLLRELGERQPFGRPLPTGLAAYAPPTERGSGGQVNIETGVLWQALRDDTLAELREDIRKNLAEERQKGVDKAFSDELTSIENAFKLKK